MTRRVLFVFVMTLALSAGAYTAAVGARTEPDFLKVHDKDGVLCGNDFSPEGINGEKCGVSGVALLGPPAGGVVRLLVVHDAKDDGGVGKRLGVVTLEPGAASRVNYRPLDWPARSTPPDDVSEPPDDLEAVTSVPGRQGLFLALTSKGRVFPLSVEGEKVTRSPSFPLPELQKRREIEGLSVQSLKGRLVIAWGYRGAGRQEGLLYYGLLHLEKLSGAEGRRGGGIITVSGKEPITVPYPSPEDRNTRHIADLKVDERGHVWAAAAYDPNDTVGPFKSAVYRLGVLDASGTHVRFERHHPLAPVRTFERKIEGVEMLPGPDGAFIFGAEDEARGGWLLRWPRKTGRAAESQRAGSLIQTGLALQPEPSLRQRGQDQK